MSNSNARSDSKEDSSVSSVTDVHGRSGLKSSDMSKTCDYREGERAEEWACLGERLKTLGADKYQKLVDTLRDVADAHERRLLLPPEPTIPSSPGRIILAPPRQRDSH